MELTETLLSLAEDACVQVQLRSFALDAIPDTGQDSDTLTRLHRLSHDDKPGVAEAALRHLWPGHVTLAQYLRLLPPGASWRYETRPEELMELVTGDNVDDALDWALEALAVDTSKAVIAIAVLAQAIHHHAQPPHSPPAPDRRKLLQGLLSIAVHEDLLHLPEARTAIESLRQVLTNGPETRRLLAAEVLHNPDQDAAEAVVFSPELGLFPDTDLLYWAERWPQLAPQARNTARTLISRRQRPQDGDLRRAVEAACMADPELLRATDWWDAPPSDWQLRNEERARQQRHINTFDEEEFAQTLDRARTAEPEHVRQAWLKLLGHLYRTHDGSRAEGSSTLGAVVAAPSYPSEDSAPHTALVEAGLHVLRTAPVWNAGDIARWGTDWRDVSELTAAAAVTEEQWEAAVPPTDVARWAGWALALATMTPPTQDQELHSRLFEQCARYAGDAFQTALAECLDRLEPYRLTELVGFLHGLLAPQSLTLVRQWAAEPATPSESWAAVMVPLTRLDSDAVLPDLQTVVAAGPSGDPDNKARWITAVNALMSLTALPDSWPHVRQAIDADNDLFRELIDR
ncbi:hypothetical protein [Streptomyces sp. NPDC090112]|uniref:hypothetical protein n=1 Tax=Streptomyces sp. NPDC090112 TaxID=3365949 RepID=UPI0038301556